MANEPYQKVAEDNNGVVLPLLGIGAGGVLAYGSSDRITGMKTLYHGTSKANADKIKKEGFKATLGGIGGAGAAIDDEAFIENSKGHVHMSSIKPYSNMYANLSGHEGIQKAFTESRNERESARNSKNNGLISEETAKELTKSADKKEISAQFKAILKPYSKKTSEVMKIQMPYMEYNELFKHDEDGGMNRFMAAKTDSDISSKYVKGGAGQLAIKDKAHRTKNGFSKYAKNHTGRFSVGIAMLGLGATSIGMGTESLLD